MSFRPVITITASTLCPSPLAATRLISDCRIGSSRVRSIETSAPVSPTHDQATEAPSCCASSSATRRGSTGPRASDASALQPTPVTSESPRKTMLSWRGGGSAERSQPRPAAAEETAVGCSTPASGPRASGGSRNLARTYSISPTRSAAPAPAP